MVVLKATYLLWLALCLTSIALLLTGCTAGVNSTLTWRERKADGSWTVATAEIPSTITASNLVITWMPATGEVQYKADWVTRSNEGVIKIQGERELHLMDSTGNLVGKIVEGAVKGAKALP